MSSPRFPTVCPKCETRLKIKYSWSGLLVRCKHCNHKFQALAPDSPPPSGAADPAGGVLSQHSIRSDGAVANPLDENGEHPRADQELRGAVAAVSASNLEMFRGVFARLLAEYGVLREERVRYRGERNTLAAQFKTVRAKYDRLKSTRHKDQLEHQRLSAELATLREALGSLTPEEIAALKAEHEALRQQNERTIAELDRLQEERDAVQAHRDAIQAQLEQLRRAQDQLRVEQDQERQAHHRLAAELATLQEALGPCTPAEIRSLKAERESLKTEAGCLREEVHALHGELSARGNLAELLAQHDDVIRSAREMSDRLKHQVEHFEAAFNGSQATRDPLHQEVPEPHNQLEAARAPWDQLHERIQERDEALRSAHAKLEELAQQLRRREDELSSKHAELERLAERRQAALKEAEQLRTTLAQYEREVRLASLQRHAEIDELQRTLDEALQKHRGERSQLAEQLRLTREQLESAESRRTAAEARISELQGELQTLKSDPRKGLGSDRSRLTTEFPTVPDAKHSLHTEALVEAALAEIQTNAWDPIRSAGRRSADILTRTESHLEPDADLEAAHREIDGLRAKLAEMQASQSSVASLLHGMGLRVH